ncbi:unnamed protein product [Urochloa decumbens]|uniref:Uncharacterized protein n=1 Tax=Urochloa decumbens TaxID=240449 RepID=A0ABC8XYV5_9POAL
MSLELMSSLDVPRDVVAMAGLRIDDPSGAGRWQPAVWRSHEAHTFKLPYGSRTWELSMPSAFKEARHVHDDRFSVTCTVDVLEDSTPAETTTRFVSVPLPPSISTDLHGLLLEGSRWPPDVTFVVEGDEVRAHKLVLSMRSPVFKAEFHGSKKKRLTRTVRVDDMSAPTFRAMLRFIYTDEMPIKPKGVASQDECRNKQVARRRAAIARDLLVAADRYGIERLRLMCESILSESIDATTVMSTLMLVEGRYSCRQLEASCIAYMASNPDTFAAVVATPEYQELRESRVSFIAGIAEKVALHSKLDANCPSCSSSSPTSLRLNKSSSTFMSLERGTHEFMIPNFSTVLRRLHVDQEIHSGRFHVGGYDWRIFCKQGELKEHKEHLSVYLHLLTDPGTDTVEVMATFYIADPNHKSPPISTWLEKVFSKENMDWGFPAFITLASAKSQYVGRDGSFTITCHIDVTKHESCGSSSAAVGVRGGTAIPVPPSNIAWHLEQLLVTQQGADVKFLVEGTTVVYAHKLVLAARSPVLYEAAASVASIDSHVRIDGMKAAVFKAVLHYIYTDELPSSGALRDDIGMAGDMLAAAERYHLERLKAVCQNILAESISTENVLNLLKIADQLHCQELKDYCVDYISTSPHVVKEVMMKSFSSFVCN